MVLKWGRGEQGGSVIPALYVSGQYDNKCTGFRANGVFKSPRVYTQGTHPGVHGCMAGCMAAEGHAAACQHQYQQYTEYFICVAHL